MPVLTNQQIPQNADRIYHVHVPANPAGPLVPAIVVFHGGGQDARVIARRWGVEPARPVPANVASYLLAFPEADARLGERWIHYRQSNTAFPTLDLEFVELLLAELTSRSYPTGSTDVPDVRANPDHVYAAGFSNGAGMVWQLMNCDLVSAFRGFASVGRALDPEKARRYRRVLADAGAVPAPVPVMYVHGTADSTYRPPATLNEVPIDTTLPAATVRELLDRNGIPANAPAASTTLVSGSTNSTEVVVQEFVGAAPNSAFTYATVINGGHNWPGPSTVGKPPVASHFDATQAILDFWQTHAALPPP